MSLPCPKCGGHRWAFEGYCLEIACAGNYNDPDYPKSKPDELKQRDAERIASRVRGSGSTSVKQPRKGTRRSEELWYESQGEVAPWLEQSKQEPPT